MIPTRWVSHRRSEDNELLGYLCPAGDAPDRFTPVIVFFFAEDRSGHGARAVAMPGTPRADQAAAMAGV
jgi:hypothetical protein